MTDTREHDQRGTTDQCMDSLGDDGRRPDVGASTENRPDVGASTEKGGGDVDLG